MTKKLLIIATFVLTLVGCAGRFTNDFRLDLQLKDYNKFESEVIVEAAFFSLRKLNECEYFQKSYPDEFLLFSALVEGEITVANYRQPNFDKSCGRARMFDNKFKMDGEKMFTHIGCHSADHTLAHEVLHLVGFDHGAELNTVIIECGIPPIKRLSAVSFERR